MHRTRFERHKGLPHDHRRTKVFVWGGLFVLLLVLGFLMWGMYQEGVRITSVSVQGTEALDKGKIANVAEEILAGAYMWVIPKNSTFIYPKDTIVDEVLDAFPRIKTIEIERDGFTQISIGIDEYTPDSLWCGEWFSGERDPTEQCYFVDSEGYVFGLAPDFSGTAYFKYYGVLPEAGHPVRQYIHVNNEFKELQTFIDLLDTLAFEPVAVYWNPDDDYIVYLKNGAELRIAMEDDLTEMFENLQVVLQSDAFLEEQKKSDRVLEYIDLRFGDRVLFRFKDASLQVDEDVEKEVMEE